MKSTINFSSNKIAFCSLFNFFFFLSLASQTISPPDTALANLRKKLSSLIEKNSSQTGASWRVKFIDLNSDAVIYSFNSEKFATPASNQKIITASAFLSLGDTSFVYTTEAWQTEDFQNTDSVYKGDIVFVSNGNPTISSRWLSQDSLFLFFRDIVKNLKDQGISKIEGDVVGDDRFYRNSYLSTSVYGEGVEFAPYWEWEDLNIYATSLSALTFNESTVEITAKAKQLSEQNSIVDISIFPDIEDLRIINYAKISNDRSEPISNYNFRTNAINIYGTLYRKWTYTQRVKIPQSSLFFLKAFKSVLLENGITLKGKCRRAKLKERFLYHKILRIHEAPPISKIIRKMLKESINYYAENLSYTLGSFLYSQPGTYRKSISALKEFIRKIDLSEKKLAIMDGSGLSRQNSISPDDLIKILSYIYKSDFFELFKHSLPISGIDGTLEDRLQDSLTTGKVFAKTGSMSQVRSLSGYIDTGNLPLIAFSIIANKYLQDSKEIEKIIDSAVIAVCKWLERKSL